MLPNMALVGNSDGVDTSSKIKERTVPLAIGPGVRGRRALGSKSARLTTIPFDPSFISFNEQRPLGYNQRKPYLPFSASPSNQRPNNQQKQQQPTASWKSAGGNNNGLRSEFSFRARAHSHKTAKNDTHKQSKSMPYLVDPKSANVKQRKASSTSPDEMLELNKNNEKSIMRQSPHDQDSSEMIMTGTGKASSSNIVPLTASKVQITRERFQMCRTKEEKEKNPDCIRLDKCALRLFPDIGGGESVSLKLLSLQHNLITKLENVPLLSQLVVLDLYDNRVERICGLQGLPSLRVLLLGKNRIKRIEGMDSLKRLEILDLHGNQLRYVDNLGSLSSLRVLNLAGNLLRNIRNLGPYGLSSLTELNLKRNRIKNLDGLQKAPHLKRLLVANNDLQSIATLAPLRKLVFLQELIIEPNQLVSLIPSVEYRNQVLTLFPNLSLIDKTSVTDEMKQEARQWHKAKLAEEEAKKKEEARRRQEMAATIGPPGSREQVIYQARQRWESLRNFVKSTNVTPSEIKPKPIKNMRTLVSASITAKSTKIIPNFDELYPPATLDLEHFPDGQTELEKMESLLSEAVINETKEELEQQNTKESIQVPAYTQVYPPEPESDPTSSPLHFTNELKVLATNSITSSQPAPNDGNKGKAVVHDENFAKEPSQNHETACITPSMESTKQIQPYEKNRTHDAASFLEPYTREAEDIMKTCPIVSPSENKTTKVAVVRPLIREMNEITEENFDSEKLTSEASLSLPQSKVSSPRLIENVVRMQRDAENEDIVESSELKENDQVITGDTIKACKEEGFVDERKDINLVDKDVDQSLNMSEVIQEKEGIEESELPPENISSCKETLTEENELPIANNTSKAKTKLLRHLRSISLDSGMQPPPQIFAPATLLHESPDDLDVVDEDDNDNEVQDFECDYDYDGGADEDAYSVATSNGTTGTSSNNTPRRSSTVIATTNRLMRSGVSFRKQTFPRTKSQRTKIRDRAAKLFGSTSEISPRSASTTTKRISSGIGSRTSESQTSNHSGRPTASGKVLRRCDSAANLTSSLASSASNNGSSSLLSGGTPKATGGGGNNIINGGIDDPGASPYRKQGIDFLVEVDGKALNVFGQGGLRHALTAFTSNVTCHVNVAKFHYITFDSIIPFFGKLRQAYPSLEHFHFRANNLCTLAQLDALSDLQGLSSLCIAKEGNPIVSHEAWAHYASYRLSHWGLQIINGKEVCSEYRGGVTPAAQAKCFESLGFLALSCLPQTALTPLAKRLHMLHCFCCCSPSTSSDESNRPQRLAVSHHHRGHSPSRPTDHGSTGNFCTAWDDDPVLLDVIGKEALVYCPPLLPPENDQGMPDPGNGLSSKSEEKQNLIDSSEGKRAQYETKRAETLKSLINSGMEIVEKVDRLERTWPTLMTEVIQEILMDYRFMDSYMKKELKKVQDATLIAASNQQQCQGKKHIRH